MSVDLVLASHLRLDTSTDTSLATDLFAFMNQLCASLTDLKT